MKLQASNPLRLIAFVAVFTLVVAACGPADDDLAAEPDDPVDEPDTDDPAPEPDEDVDVDGPITAADRGFDPNDWDAVLAAAEGTEVNLHMWGGEETLNNYVLQTLGGFVQEEYGVTLNLIPLGDTVDGVNSVLAEIQAGRINDGGSVDLIWVNGENYFTMNQADALLLEWERDLPNAQYVNWEDESMNMDFGFPVQGQNPWHMSAWQMIWDSDRMSEDEVPSTFAELREWIMDNPGRFTYVAPPEFGGTRFVQYVLFELTGGFEEWQDFDPDTFVEDSRPVWEYLKEIEPYLWEEGQTYPSGSADLNGLFANREVDFTFTFTMGGIGANVAAGSFPDTARPAVIQNSQGGSASFLGMPRNTSNPAGAMVVANASIDPMQQVIKFQPEQSGEGLVVDVSRIPDEAQSLLDEIIADLAPFALPPEVLQAEQIPNAGPEVLAAIEEHWERFIRQGQPLP